MLIFQILEQNGEAWGEFSNNWKEAHERTFSPSINKLYCYDFKTKGKTYEERKEYIREKAKEWQSVNAESQVNYDWLTIGRVEAMFEELAKKHGLLKEFKENAIC